MSFKISFLLQLAHNMSLTFFYTINKYNPEINTFPSVTQSAGGWEPLFTYDSDKMRNIVFMFVSLHQYSNDMLNT